MANVVLLLTLLFLLTFVQSLKRELAIGAVFGADENGEEIAFKTALERAGMFSEKIRFTTEIVSTPREDPYRISKAACELAASGVAAIVATAPAASVAAKLEIPAFQLDWETPIERYSPVNRMSLNYYPDSVALSSALAALVADYGWTSFIILYETDEGLMRLQEILKNQDSDSKPVVVRQLKPNADNRPLLKDIRLTGGSNIILDCETSRILDYLRQAQEVRLFEDYQNYILTSLDAHILDFEELKDSLANVTTLRMFDPEDMDIKGVVRDWRSAGWRGRNVFIRMVLAADAAMHATSVFNDLSDNLALQTRSLKCNGTDIWDDGFSVLHYMKIRPSKGLTGPIEFDDYGRRSHFELQVAQRTKYGFKKIATWNSRTGITSTRSESEVTAQMAEIWQRKTFIVTSRIGPPYLRMKEPADGEVLTGNNRYEGFSMDVIDGISKILNFSYEFELVPDGKYGSLNHATGEWDGLVKRLLDRKADLAICDLTITFDRRSAVDFSMPFMTTGISILFRKPIKKAPDLFSFMEPLSIEVWMLTATSMLMVSFSILLMARMSPSDWENPHRCNKNPKELENIWGIRNCTWLTIASFMQQGCDILPNTQRFGDVATAVVQDRLETAFTLDDGGCNIAETSGVTKFTRGMSARWVTGLWWFFVLIVTQSYIANMAAFLTSERMDSPITGAEDLAKQTKIKYGVIQGGSTQTFFKESNYSTYNRMWTAMEQSTPSVFTKTNEEGIDRVSKGKGLYAFLMESTSIEYIMQRNCDLNQIGNPLDSKGYGIAMPTNSPYRTDISQAVLKMQEGGELNKLKRKWWEEMNEGGSCDDILSEEDEIEAAKLQMANVGGVFLVLGCGCGLAICVAFLEFMWNVRKIAVEEKVRQRDAFVTELLFTLNINATSKPVRHTDISSSSSSSSHSSTESGKKLRMPSLLKAATSFINLDKVY